MSAPFRSALYAGELIHDRRDVHARRRFRHRVYLAAIDLDELDLLDRELRCFSRNRPNLFSLADRDYSLSGSSAPFAHASAASRGALREALGACLGAHGLPMPARTRLITNLRVLGYVFNPVSFFLNYDAAGALSSVVAEVNNTYGGRHDYALGPAQRVASTGDRRVAYRTARELFVSPFLHGDAAYEFGFEAPLDGDALALTVHLDAQGEVAAEGPKNGSRVFTAHFAGARRPLSDRSLARIALEFPLMTVQVIGRIYLEAFKLHALRVPYRRPGADHRPLAGPPEIVTAPAAGWRPGFGRRRRQGMDSN